VRRTFSLLAAAAVLTLTAAACTAPTTPTTNWAHCPAATAGNVQVAVVVANAPAATRVVCVVVADGSNGIDALNARAVRINAAAPRIDAGFVCGIDGAPAAPECSASTPDGYRLWGYWLGGSSWTSATIGAGSRVLHQGDVDGWVFGTWDFVNTFPTPPAIASSFAALTS
jgi:hypothetical protein